jgi:hypothetical protein
VTDAAYQFRDPSTLANWARGLLYAEAALAAVAIISGVMEYSVLNAMKNGAYSSEAEMIAAAEANDARQMIIGIVQFAVIIASIIVFLMWVYRSNKNARALTAQSMHYTPGWSVGWFFIPIANFWKPYQAVKEIWLASGDPANAGASNPQPLLGWWWFFWLISLFASNAAFRLTLRAESMDDFIIANIVTIISDALDIPSCLLTAAVVAGIHKMQMARVSGQPPVIA